MDQLSRETAEKLIETHTVVKTTIRQDKAQLCVYLDMANGMCCLVKYNKKSKLKEYFLEPDNPKK